MTTFSGPMFESKDSVYWQSVHKKEGAHYNIFRAQEDPCGVETLKDIWSDGDEVDELNFILFGTSGIHGSYGAVKNLRESFEKYGINSPDGTDDFEYPDGYTDQITFLVIQPRIVALRYGNVRITSKEDLIYLETLRDRSLDAVKEFLR